MKQPNPGQRQHLADGHNTTYAIFCEKGTKNIYIQQKIQSKICGRNKLRSEEISNYLDSIWTSISSRNF